MNDGKRQVMGESKPDENPIATIHYENGTELTGKAVTLQDGTVGVRIPNEFFKTALLPDGSMPVDFLPVLKGGDSYTVRLNEGLRFGGFPFHRRPRCGRLATTPVLRRLHGRLTTRRVPPRQGCSRPRSSHGRAGHRT